MKNEENSLVPIHTFTLRLINNSLKKYLININGKFQQHKGQIWAHLMSRYSLYKWRADKCLVNETIRKYNALMRRGPNIKKICKCMHNMRWADFLFATDGRWKGFISSRLFHLKTHAICRRATCVNGLMCMSTANKIIPNTTRGNWMGACDIKKTCAYVVCFQFPCCLTHKASAFGICPPRCIYIMYFIHGPTSAFSHETKERFDSHEAAAWELRDLKCSESGAHGIIYFIYRSDRAADGVQFSVPQAKMLFCSSSSRRAG